MATIASDAPTLLSGKKNLSGGRSSSPVRSPIGILLLAVVAILVVAGLARQFFSPPPVKTTVSVVGAAQDIQPGSRMSFSNLHYIEIPKRYLTPDMMTSSEQAVGSVTRLFLPAGEPITGAHVFPNKQTLASACKPDERAVTLRLDDDALVDHSIFPGDTVDVLVTVSKNGKKFTKTICQNLTVLMCATKNGLQSRARANNNNVTLAAPPEHVEFLSEAAESGKLRLSLRSKFASAAAMNTLSGVSEEDILPAKANHSQLLPWTMPTFAPPPPAPVSALAPPPQPAFAESAPVVSEINKGVQWLVTTFSGSKKEIIEVGNK